MPSIDHIDEFDERRQRRIGAALLVLGLLVVAASAVKIQKEQAYLTHQAELKAHAQVAQAQPADQNATQPAESKPGGTRPTTPAPEPARPQTKPGETTGSAPQSTPQVGTPLPQAPAEKMGPPIERK
jgi:hypothetical protein